MKKQGLLMSTMLLTLASLITRTIGMISIAAISQTIGSEGVGLYQLSMSVYFMAVIFASAGMTVSVSKLVAEDMSTKDYHNVKKVMQAAFCLSGLLGSIACISLFIFAKDIATLFIKDERATLGLKALSFSIPFMSIASCLKGYFYAAKMAIKPASSDVIEQCVKLSLIIIFMRLWAPLGIDYACVAIGLGMTIGEVVSFSYLLILYLLDKEFIDKGCQYKKGNKKIEFKSAFVRILEVVLPIAAASYLSSVLVTAENMLIPIGLRKYGETMQDSMSIYGLLKGMVIPILFFPAAFLTAFATTLIPEIARANILKNNLRVKNTTARVIHFTFVLSAFVVGAFINYADELGVIIYHSDEVGRMLKIVTVIAPFIYIEMVSDGILKGLGEQMSCLKYSMVDSIFRISMIYFIIPYKGLTAFIGIMIVSNIITSLLNFNKLIQVTNIKIEVSKWILKPFIAALATTLLSKTMYRYLFFSGGYQTQGVIFSIAIAMMLYATFLVLIESISTEDIKWFRNSVRIIMS